MIVMKVLRQMSKSMIQLWMRCLERYLESTGNSDILKQVCLQYQIKYHSDGLIPQLEIFGT